MNQQSVPYRRSLGVLVGAIACLLPAMIFGGDRELRMIRWDGPQYPASRDE